MDLKEYYAQERGNLILSLQSPRHIIGHISEQFAPASRHTHIHKTHTNNVKASIVTRENMNYIYVSLVKPTIYTKSTPTLYRQVHMLALYMDVRFSTVTTNTPVYVYLYTYLSRSLWVSDTGSVRRIELNKTKIYYAKHIPKITKFMLSKMLMMDCQRFIYFFACECVCLFSWCIIYIMC